MYAIIEDSGSQIKVSEGDVIRVATRDLAADQATLTFDRVLAIGGVEGKNAQIGTPVVTGATVQADLLGEGRTDKVPVVKFKRRKGYTRRRGHRQDFLQVKVTSIKA